MVVGVGIDIVKIDKMRRSIEQWGDSFLERVFNKEEINKIARGKMFYQRLAARFAAKEAVIKAISKKYPLALRDILVLNRDNGAPYCKLKKDKDVVIMLSIAHIEDYAVACAVAQSEEGRSKIENRR